MLKEYATQAYMEKGFNCAESMLWAIEQEYGVGLKEEDLKYVGAFGGGMFYGSACGAICGTMAALGKLRIGTSALVTEGFREECKALAEAFQEKLGAFDCRDLTPMYKKEDGTRCLATVLLACEVAEDFIGKSKG